MSYQSTIRLAQHALGVDFRKPMRRRRDLGLPGGALWLAGSKIGLTILAVVLCLNLWMGLAAGNACKTIQEIEATRHRLKDEQIALLAERANLMSKKEVGRRVGDELALYLPEKGQVLRLR